ncbi:hypothetical protein (DUF688) [Arabidopsis thaliana]|uniref:Uncharacterized protein At4g18630 n=1 Tax=Arabidopsis thaliana TaxID=3702 RepID=Q8GYP4_ARATH|nr:hypothetical protein (DUF688) [Arabidopsis thaliana]AAO63825.1 unknown protein [Arabidopsis thaliana]AEE84070.1 hypothetical protein (DUF688) [Arabidopsis thaliana]BAC42134.1 unknown protein [Arabidopsis thaliana]|eukprot:NP_193598.2 hypothetical protein (DUF688) [Arabidopsis thaliana]
MEGKKLNLYAPLPSIRRIPSMIERSSELENKKTTITRPELRSCPSTKQETPVFVLPDQSFDHLTEPASIPFMWEQIPGKPKDDMATLIQESGLLETDDEEEDEVDEDLDTVSSNVSFSVNCSTSGVSEIEKTGERSDCDEKSRESLDLMMSRFLPAAKAMALQTHQKHQSSYNSSEQKLITQNREALVARQRSQLVAEHEHFAIVQSLYDDLNIDDDTEDDENDDDGDDYGHVDHKIYPAEVTKKACGFLPRLCAKNSFKFLNPVPLDSVSNRSMKHSGDQTSLPNWSTRRLSGFISPYRTSCSDSGFLGTPEKPESFKRLNRGISKSQELYPTRTRREVLPNYSNSGEIKMFRNSISTPSRIQRTTIHDSRFLVEEVNRRRNNKSGNLQQTSSEYTPALSPPPLPETPSRSWLGRTLLPPVNPRPYGVVLGQVGIKKLNQEVLESTKWETIVKTSYVHNDHARYSQELIVYPSRQQNT